jgi:hypothetical protein
MNADGPNRRILLLLFSVLGPVLIDGCHRPSAPRVAPNSLASQTDDSSESAREILRKGVGVNAYRNAIQQLNTYFTRNAAEVPPALTQAERENLAQLLGLDDAELAEAASPTFTLLDAHYLDLCFLSRDAIRSFDAADATALRRAESAFSWLMRQVRLQERNETTAPQYALRRGWGSSLERSFVFLGLLQQLGLDGCMITVPAVSEASAEERRPWLPAVRVDEDIYLFDTRLGLPLPGPGGRGIATLKQVRSQPDILQPLMIDARHRYDMTPDIAGQAEVQPACPLSALAPRMKYLQASLTSHNKVNLAIDASRLTERLRKAAEQSGSRLQTGAKGSGFYAYATLLRDFMPPSEGGTDQFGRKEQAEGELFPLNALPVTLRNPIYQSAGLVQRLIKVYIRLFVQFPLPAPRNVQIQENHNLFGIGKDPDPHSGDLIHRFVTSFLVPTMDSAGPPDVYYGLAPKSARDDILRGRFDDATSKLVEALDQVRYQKALGSNTPGMNRELRQWCEEAVAAQAALQRADREATRSQNAKAADELAAARQRLNRLWLGDQNLALIAEEEGKTPQERKGVPLVLPLQLRVILRAAAGPMEAEATYWLALCKHEQAELIQGKLGRAGGSKPSADIEAGKKAWKTAADWWNTYLEEHPKGSGAAAARLNEARALEMLNDREKAGALLKNPAGLTPLEETGRLYRAKLLAAPAK